MHGAIELSLPRFLPAEFDAPNCIHIESTKILVKFYDESNSLFPCDFLEGQYCIFFIQC